MISMRIKNVNPKGWYDIPGYDGIYQINYWADIRKKLGNGKYKYLKPYVKKNNQGKRLIKLKRKEVVVMSLMRITFIGDLPKGYVTYHKNGIKTDDILGNIGVITKKELSKKTGQMNGRMCKVPSVALCERIYGTNIERIGEYIRSCTEEEMQRIDEAIMLTLGIIENNNVADQERIKQLEEQLAKEKETSDRILAKFREETERYNELEREKGYGNDKEYIRAIAERDVYKSMYMDLLERKMNG